MNHEYLFYTLVGITNYIYLLLSYQPDMSIPTRFSF